MLVIKKMIIAVVLSLAFFSGGAQSLLTQAAHAAGDNAGCADVPDGSGGSCLGG